MLPTTDYNNWLWTGSTRTRLDLTTTIDKCKLLIELNSMIRIDITLKVSNQSAVLVNAGPVFLRLQKSDETRRTEVNVATDLNCHNDNQLWEWHELEMWNSKFCRHTAMFGNAVQLALSVFCLKKHQIDTFFICFSIFLISEIKKILKKHYFEYFQLKNTITKARYTALPNTNEKSQKLPCIFWK